MSCCAFTAVTFRAGKFLVLTFLVLQTAMTAGAEAESPQMSSQLREKESRQMYDYYYSKKAWDLKRLEALHNPRLPQLEANGSEILFNACSRFGSIGLGVWFAICSLGATAVGVVLVRRRSLSRWKSVTLVSGMFLLGVTGAVFSTYMVGVMATGSLRLNNADVSLASDSIYVRQSGGIVAVVAYGGLGNLGRPVVYLQDKSGVKLYKLYFKATTNVPLGCRNCVVEGVDLEAAVSLQKKRASNSRRGEGESVCPLVALSYGAGIDACSGFDDFPRVLIVQKIQPNNQD